MGIMKFVLGDRLYHLAPNGVEKCHIREGVASTRGCHIEPERHFRSLEAANEGQAFVEEHTTYHNELKRLESVLSGLPSYKNQVKAGFYRSSVSVGGHVDQRDFANNLDNWAKENGKYPELFENMIVYQMGDSDRLVEVILQRKNIIDDAYPRFDIVWTASIQRNHYWQGKENKKTVREISLDITNDDLDYNHLLVLKDLIREAINLHGELIVFNESYEKRMQDKVDEIFAQFLSIFSAVESEAQGEQNVSDWDYGYFTKSNSQQIIVEEDYHDSAFRGKNFRNFMKDNGRWAMLPTPEALISITDHNTNSGTWWALRKFDGKWSVETQRLDGSRTDNLVATPKDAYDNVYWSVMDHVNVGWSAMAFQKAQYAYDLMTAVEESLEEHGKDTAFRLERERLAKIAKEHGKDTR